jgi:toxin FitB
LKWLADTNVISETKRPKTDANVISWIAETPHKSLYTTAVNIAELEFGIRQLSETAKSKDLATWLKYVVRPWYGDKIFAVDEESLVVWQ